MGKHYKDLTQAETSLDTTYIELDVTDIGVEHNETKQLLYLRVPTTRINFIPLRDFVRTTFPDADRMFCERLTDQLAETIHRAGMTELLQGMIERADERRKNEAEQQW